MKTLGDKLEPIIDEIYGCLLDQYETPAGFSDKAFFDITGIFMSAIIDRVWTLQESEGIKFSNREEMVTKCGHELRKLIKTYTGVDTVELAREMTKPTANM